MSNKIESKKELSNKLKEDTYFYQRSVEYNYPIRINSNSKFIFLGK